MTGQLTLPAGIDDASTRALLKVLERWDNIPVEVVLVWLVDHVVADALPFIADGLGLSGPEFEVAGAPPREFLRKGLELRRKRGTGDALERVLAALGYDDVTIEEDTRQFHDGSITRRDGTQRHGWDAHWAIYRVHVTVADPMPMATALKLWDVINVWKPKSRWPILVLHEGAATPRWFRARSEIDEPPEPADDWSPLDDVAMVSGLYLPGGYATTGTPGVDETSQWADASGNARHFVNSTAIVVNTAPPATVGASDGSSTAAAGSDVTFTSASAHFDGDVVGKSVVVSGAATPSNNGTFPITARPSSTSIVYTNASGTVDANDGALSYAITLGYPRFDGGVTYGGLIAAGKSIAGDFATDIKGAFIVIASHAAPLDPSVGSYQNSAMVEGSGASPHLVSDDTDGLRAGGYDGGTYIESNTPGVVADTAYVCAMKWDAAGICNSLAGAAWSAATPWAGGVSLDGPNVGADTYIGMGYGQAYQWNGAIKAVAFYPDAADVDNAKLAQWQAWAVAQGLV